MEENTHEGQYEDPGIDQDKMMSTAQAVIFISGVVVIAAAVIFAILEYL